MAELLAPIVARRGPAAPALVDERGTTTWGELDERANRLIHAFRAAGLGVGDTISLMARNRREWFEVYTAATHTGLTVVPVNWHWVADELAYVLDNSDSKALVAADALARSPGVTTVVTIGRDYEDLVASGSPDEPADQSTGGPMFYTSGTTGFPKGVRSTASTTGSPMSSSVGAAAVAQAVLGYPVDGVTLLVGPAYHSAQWAFSVLPLAVGSTIVMREGFDPAEALRLIEEHGVTNVHLVPTQFIRFLKLPDEVRASFDPSSLQVVMHGAAPCSMEVKRRMLEWWGPVITEYYGGTESGFLSFISGTDWLAKPGSVGVPVATMEVKILDDEGNEQPPGTPGQIWTRSRLGGDFRYHKDDAKTAAAHRDGGLQSLGDIGYLDEDGYLFLSDRKIDMIISGGVNIYPAEIEGVLVTHPQVADAAVFGVPDDEFGEAVKAAVQLVDGAVPGDDLAADITAHCREHLAGYKVPRSVDFEAELPRTPTGKLYKRLLRDRYWEGTGRSL
jgi:long-chain acyl-CoA synthetase